MLNTHLCLVDLPLPAHDYTGHTIARATTEKSYWLNQNSICLGCKHFDRSHALNDFVDPAHKSLTNLVRMPNNDKAAWDTDIAIVQSEILACTKKSGLVGVFCNVLATQGSANGAVRNFVCRTDTWSFQIQ